MKKFLEITVQIRVQILLVIIRFAVGFSLIIIARFTLVKVLYSLFIQTDLISFGEFHDVEVFWCLLRTSILFVRYC